MLTGASIEQANIPTKGTEEGISYAFFAKYPEAAVNEKRMSRIEVKEIILTTDR